MQKTSCGLNVKMAAFLEEMEYRMNFPRSVPRFFTQGKDKEDFVFVYEEKKLPVVILLGWLGCQDKYLSKYSAIYDDHGCITLRCTPPAGVTLLRHEKLKKLGERLLEILHETSLDEHPIFFHIFSNGGSFFYQSISSYMKKKQMNLDVKGVIFDSAPGKSRFYSLYRTISAITGGSAWLNIPFSLLLTLVLFLTYIIYAFFKAGIEIKKPQTDPIMLAEEPFDWPQLFIYSKDDELVRSEDVEEFALMREQRRVLVKRLCFESSPHVQHLLMHREAYISTVMNFIEECLKDTKMLN